MKLFKNSIFLIIMGFFTVSLAYPGKIVKKFNTPYSCPTGLTFDGANLWIADHKADKLTCIDPNSGEIIREIPSPGFWPMGLAWDGEYLWNLDNKQNKIFKIDSQSGEILFVIDAPESDCEGLTWDGETLWVSDYRAKKIMKIDLSDGTAVKTYAAPANYTEGLTFDGTYLWCSDRYSDEIYMIDPSNGEVIIIIEAPGPYTRGMAWDGEYLWNVDYQNDEIYQLVRKDDELYKLKNTRTAKVTYTHQVKPFGNGKLLNLDTYIAIPDNIPQQKINKVEFSGEYKTVTDKWDQKYAHFNYKNIPAGDEATSIMTVETEISEINYYIFPDNCGTVADIPKDILKTYTANGSKYQTDDEYIQKFAKQLKGDQTNPYWIARSIFDHVRLTVEYKLEGGWNVAPVVLQRETGSCSEYTFAFISLCRAAGIPARYVGAVVVRGDDASLDDVFHRWPEIYLPNYGWIPIDPQGGDKVRPRDRAMNIGHLSNRFLITTHCGGFSKYMGWYYNSYETYQLEPKTQVNIETIGEWDPILD